MEQGQYTDPNAIFGLPSGDKSDEAVRSGHAVVTDLFSNRASMQNGEVRRFL